MKLTSDARWRVRTANPRPSKARVLFAAPRPDGFAPWDRCRPARRCSNPDQFCSFSGQRCSISGQIYSISDQGCSISGQRYSISDQRCSISGQICSISDQFCSISDQRWSVARDYSAVGLANSRRYQVDVRTYTPSRVGVLAIGHRECHTTQLAAAESRCQPHARAAVAENPRARLPRGVHTPPALCVLRPRHPLVQQRSPDARGQQADHTDQRPRRINLVRRMHQDRKSVV